MAIRQWDTLTIKELLFEAGSIALGMADAPEVSVKADNSLVTEADRKIEQLIIERCEDTDAGIYVIGEETASDRDARYISSALERTAWIVDPIDGTAAYARGLPTWGISIALLEKRKLVHGALYLPITGEIVMTADDDQVLYGTIVSEPAVYRPAPNSPGSTDRLMISLSHSIAKHGLFDRPNPIQSISSCVWSLVKLITGTYGGYIGSVKLWDIAGGLPILERLGYAVMTAGGAVLDTTVEPENYVLDYGDPRCFSVHDHLFIARDPEFVRLLIHNTVFNQSFQERR